MDDMLPPKPDLAMRLGITGARKLNADRLDGIERQLQEVITLVKSTLTDLALRRDVTELYRHEPGGDIQPEVCLITPLAAGSDRMAARSALAHACSIYVPMPFSQTVYEEDFTAEGDCAAFRELLAKATGTLELDGRRSASSEDDGSDGRAYEAVGRFVVRHCDLLIAVWDGKQSRGRGGTAEIVHYAAAAGVPVWWIHALDEKAPQWLGSIDDLQCPVLHNEDAADLLQAHMNHLIAPPPHVRTRSRNWLEVAISRFEQKDASPLEVYFHEQPQRITWKWKTFSVMMRWAGRGGYLPVAETVSAADPAARFWFDRYLIADAQAKGYAARYRSGYLLTIFLTTLALLFGALGQGSRLFERGHADWHLALWMAIGEFAALIMIVVLVGMSIHYEWHRKSIDYRLLAELFRKQETLAALGWALSLGNVQRLADAEWLNWVTWLFAADQRCAVLPRGRPAQQEDCRQLLFGLIDEQRAYHRSRETVSEKASRTFEKLSNRTFLLVVVIVFAKVATEMSGGNADDRVVILLGLLATVLPGISAAFFAIRSYSELQLLAEQSRHMIVELDGARRRAERLPSNQALISQHVGAQAAVVATLMLQDLDGWGRLFRGKLMDAS